MSSLSGIYCIELDNGVPALDVQSEFSVPLTSAGNINTLLVYLADREDYEEKLRAGFRLTNMLKVRMLSLDTFELQFRGIEMCHVSYEDLYFVLTLAKKKYTELKNSADD